MFAGTIVENILATTVANILSFSLCSLMLSLSRSREKTKILEERIDQLLTEKNGVIKELEERVRQLEQELKLSRQSAERLRRSLQTLEGVGQGGVEGDIQAEVLTLHETLDQLRQQLASSSEESQTLHWK
jgi:cell shape-determining protein MreC